jgi:anti-sigma-K factor RskA
MRDEHRPNTTHSAESEQLAALYALGALEGSEQLAFRQHLAACLGCQQLVDRDLETLARLSAAAPEADARPGFREQLRARAARELERRASPEP